MKDSLHSLLDYECLLFLLWRTSFWFTNRSLLQLPLPTEHSTAGHNSPMNECRLILSNEPNSLFYNMGRTEYKSPCLTIPLFSVFKRCRGKCLPNRCPAIDHSACIRCGGNVITEPLPSKRSYSSQYLPTWLYTVSQPSKTTILTVTAVKA
jgi:hypothetical protein